MATLANLDIEVGLRADQAIRGMARLEDNVKSFRSELRSMGRVAARVAATGLAALGAAAAGLTASVLKVGSETEQARIKLDSLFGSMERGRRAFETVREVAATLPFTFSEILETSQGLASVVEGPQELEKRLRQITELAARFPITLQDATSNFIRFSQAGAGAADLFRDAGINAAIGIKAGMETTTEESMRLWDQFFTEIERSGTSAIDRLAGSFTGIVSMLQDLWRDFRQLIADAGVFDATTEALDGMRETIQDMADNGQLQRIAEAFADVIEPTIRKSADHAERFLQALAKSPGKVEETADTIKNMALAFVGLAKIVDNTFELVATAIGLALDTAFVAVGETINTFLIRPINAVLNILQRDVRLAILNTGAAVERMGRELKEARGVMSDLAEGGRMFGEALDLGTDDLRDKVVRPIQTFGETVVGMVTPTLSIEEGLAGSADGAERLERNMGGAAGSTEEVLTAMERLDELLTDASEESLNLEEALDEVLPSLEVIGNQPALAQALSVADELGATEQFLEWWKALNSEAEVFVETVEEGASVHELIVGQMADANDEAADLGREIERAVRGAFDLASAFGVVDNATARVLNSVVNLAQNVSEVISGLQAGASFGALAGPIGGALAAAGSIFQGLMQADAQREKRRQQLIERHADAVADMRLSVTLLSQNIDKLASIAVGLGGERIGGLQKFLEGLQEITPLGLEHDYLDVMNALEESGLSLLELSRFAEEAGFSIDTLIKAMQGNIDSIEELQDAGIELEQLMEAIEDVTDAADSFEAQMLRVAQAFRDARQASSLMIDVFDIEAIGQKVSILVGDLESALGEALPEIFQQLQAADLSTRSGIEQAKELLQSIFLQGAGAFGLPQDVFREFVSSMDRLLDQALGDLEGAATGGGGSTSGVISMGGGRTTRPDFSQRSVITEVQAEERNVLLRSQLAQEEMQTELQRAMIRVIADLPSNIRDGVDIALGEDQLVGAS